MNLNSSNTKRETAKAAIAFTMVILITLFSGSATFATGIGTDGSWDTAWSPDGIPMIVVTGGTGTGTATVTVNQSQNCPGPQTVIEYRDKLIPCDYTGWIREGQCNTTPCPAQQSCPDVNVVCGNMINTNECVNHGYTLTSECNTTTPANNCDGMIPGNSCNGLINPDECQECDYSGLIEPKQCGDNGWIPGNSCNGLINPDECQECDYTGYTPSDQCITLDDCPDPEPCYSCVSHAGTVNEDGIATLPAQDAYYEMAITWFGHDGTNAIIIETESIGISDEAMDLQAPEKELDGTVIPATTWIVTCTPIIIPEYVEPPLPCQEDGFTVRIDETAIGEYKTPVARPGRTVVEIIFDLPENFEEGFYYIPEVYTKNGRDKNKLGKDCQINEAGRLEQKNNGTWDSGLIEDDEEPCAISKGWRQVPNADELVYLKKTGNRFDVVHVDHELIESDGTPSSSNSWDPLEFKVYPECAEDWTPGKLVIEWPLPEPICIDEYANVVFVLDSSTSFSEENLIAVEDAVNAFVMANPYNKFGYIEASHYIESHQEVLPANQFNLSLSHTHDKEYTNMAMWLTEALGMFGEDTIYILITDGLPNKPGNENEAKEAAIAAAANIDNMIVLGLKTNGNSSGLGEDFLGQLSPDWNLLTNMSDLEEGLSQTVCDTP